MNTQYKALEHRLALRIATSVLGVLFAIILSIGASFYLANESGNKETLSNWLVNISRDPRMSMVITRVGPLELTELFRDMRRMPQPLRNILVYFKTGEVVIKGPLEFVESEELLKSIQNIRPDQPFSQEVQGRKYIFLGKEYSDRTIYVYASTDGELARFSSLLVYFAIACLLFVGGLYVLSRKFAREAFTPMKESLEMMGLYNRNIAHELRTPLAVLQSDLELMENTKNPHVVSALEEVSSIRNTIDALLFLAENQSIEQMDSVSVREVLQKKRELLTKVMPER